MLMLGTGIGLNFLCDVQQGIQLETPMCDELFPRAALLLGDTSYQRALEFVSSRRRMDRYRSMMDYLFAESVWGYQSKCFAYYRGDAPSLRDLPGVTPAQLERWDRYLVEVLNTAQSHCERHQAIAWRQLYHTHSPLLKAA